MKNFKLKLISVFLLTSFFGSFNSTATQSDEKLNSGKYDNANESQKEDSDEKIYDIDSLLKEARLNKEDLYNESKKKDSNEKIYDIDSLLKEARLNEEDLYKEFDLYMSPLNILSEELKSNQKDANKKSDKSNISNKPSTDKNKKSIDINVNDSYYKNKNKNKNKNKLKFNTKKEKDNNAYDFSNALELGQENFEEKQTKYETLEKTQTNASTNENKISINSNAKNSYNKNKNKYNPKIYSDLFNTNLNLIEEDVKKCYSNVETKLKDTIESYINSINEKIEERKYTDVEEKTLDYYNIYYEILNLLGPYTGRNKEGKEIIEYRFENRFYYLKSIFHILKLANKILSISLQKENNLFSDEIIKQGINSLNDKKIKCVDKNNTYIGDYISNFIKIYCSKYSKENTAYTALASSLCYIDLTADNLLENLKNEFSKEDFSETVDKLNRYFDQFQKFINNKVKIKSNDTYLSFFSKDCYLNLNNLYEFMFLDKKGCLKDFLFMARYPQYFFKDNAETKREEILGNLYKHFKISENNNKKITIAKDFDNIAENLAVIKKVGADEKCEVSIMSIIKTFETLKDSYFKNLLYRFKKEKEKPCLAILHDMEVFLNYFNMSLICEQSSKNIINVDFGEIFKILKTRLEYINYENKKIKSKEIKNKISMLNLQIDGIIDNYIKCKNYKVKYIEKPPECVNGGVGIF